MRDAESRSRPSAGGTLKYRGPAPVPVTPANTARRASNLASPETTTSSAASTRPNEKLLQQQQQVEGGSAKGLSVVAAARVVDIVRQFADVGCTSKQVLEELGVAAGSDAAKAVAKALSVQSTRVCSRRQELHGKPIIRLPAPPGSDAKVIYVHADEFLAATAEERCRLCFLCGKNTLGAWQVLGGDYSQSTRVAAFRDALVHCICEVCFRASFLGVSSAEPVGFAVLPHGFFSPPALAKRPVAKRPVVSEVPTLSSAYANFNANAGIAGPIASIERKMQAACAQVSLLASTRDKVLSETVTEVRNFGTRGGTWHDIVERVGTAILPQKLENLKEVVQWSLHVSSSKTLSSDKPLLRRAMIGFDGAVQILFVAKEFVDPHFDTEGGARRNGLACGICLEVAEQTVPGAIFGLRSFTNFRVLVEGGEGLPGFEVLRRYSDFAWLREELEQWHGDESVVPPLPRKRFLGRFNETFLEARMHALEHFLAIAAVHPVLHKAEALQAFFKRCPLDQAKPDYYARTPQRAAEKRSRRRRSAEWAAASAGAPFDPETEKPAIVLQDGAATSKRPSVDLETLDRLLLSGGTRRRDGDVRVILGRDYQRALRKCYKRMEELATCFVKQAALQEDRAKACKFLAATELPEIRTLANDPRRFQELLHAVGADAPVDGPATNVFSEVPLTSDRLPLPYSAMAVVELLSSLSRMDIVAATANRAASIRHMETKMQLKEWQRSLQEATAWFENRAHSVVLLQRSVRAKQSLLDGAHLGINTPVNSAENQSPGSTRRGAQSNVDDDDNGVHNAKTGAQSASAARHGVEMLEEKIKSTRADASLEANWLSGRNKQEIVSHMTTFVEHQIEHARQQSRMWQEFLPQLLASLEAQVPLLSGPLDADPGDAQGATSSTDTEALARGSSNNKSNPHNNENNNNLARRGGALMENSELSFLDTDVSLMGGYGQQAFETDEKTRMAQAQNDGAWEIDPADLVFGNCIGRGSFGEVHEGVFHGQRVAIKTFHTTSSLSARALLDFRREAQVMRGLPSHENLVSFFGMSSQPKNICLVMELVATGSMLELLLRKDAAGGNVARPPPLRHGTNENAVVNANITVRRGGRGKRAAGSRNAWDLDELDPQWRIKLALGAARGIRVLHESVPQILHRDIKTSNLLVSMPDLTVKVCDFGLARFKLETQSVRSFVGTASWVAPEVIISREDGYSAKADVYSFAVVLWQIYARRQPYPKMHATQVLYQVAREGLRPRMPASVPAPMDKLIRECWATDAAQRPVFKDVEARLEAMMNES
ncbi:Protein kinase, putative [Hondaea fermentalgiana]|uniref:Protein kinase, putative n=1 Tax=Hondaea fermentalgiana TaxID=2315210 RepID=A0A2R5G6N6_9STRA|nr:Protein kinase, putative [Hondaea fermentalgiana]|eukprot:GBG24103.1 Protein kinase, putative [Hondaea fermentalgiana]